AVTLTPAQLLSKHFSFHSCVQVTIDTVAGEVVTSNQLAQENFSNFEAVLDPTTLIGTPIKEEIFLRNPYGPNQPPFEFGPRTVYLGVQPELPPDWTYSVNDGLLSPTLDAGEIRQLPVMINVPSGSPIGQTYLLKVDARTDALLTNPAIPPSGSTPNTHGASQV